MRTIMFITEMFKKFPFLMTVNLLLLMVVNFFNIGSLFAIGPLVDFVIHPDLQNISPLTEKMISVIESFAFPVSLSSFLLFFVSFVFFGSLFQAVSEYVVQKTRFKIVEALFSDCLNSFLSAKWQFFVGQKQGEFINLFSRELIMIASALGQVSQFTVGVVQIFFFLSVPFYISWQVTLLCIIGIVLLSIPFILFGRYGYVFGKKGTDYSKEFISLLNENFNLLKIVLGFANQKKCHTDLVKAYVRYANTTIQWLTLGNALFLLFRPVAVLIVAIALFFSRKFNVPVSEMSVLLLGFFQIAKSAGACVNMNTAIGNFFPSYELMKSLKEKADLEKQFTGMKIFKTLEDRICLKNLSFSYQENEWALKSINIIIEKSKMIALVGKSGSGKSTLIDMIMGFNEPQVGCIECDGVDIHKIDIDSYRSRIGYVPQDSVLFNTSIKENFLWAKPDASEKDIKEACFLAHADEFIDNFPEKYDTIVGDRGVRLSGGQLQRVALARAFLKKPDLLILDEATSSLDSHSEKLIQDAIDKFAIKTTVVIIAHRLSTVRKADHIYVLDQGKIVEEGKYNDLISKRGRFSSMVDMQELTK